MSVARYAERMRRLIAPAALIAVLALAGCSGAEQEPAPQPSEPMIVAPNTPEVEPQAETISEVFDKIDCIEGDVLGTRGKITDGFEGKTPPIIKQGDCKPIEDAERVLFWQFESPEDARAFLDTGQLEAAESTDAVYTDGKVVILARDAATSALFTFATLYQ